MQRLNLALWLWLLLVPVSTCLAAKPASYTLLASVRPITLLARELVGDLPVQVDTLLPAGATTHDYALSPSDLVRLRAANRVVWLGQDSEPYLRRVMAQQQRNLAWGDLPDVLKLPNREALHLDAETPEHADHDHEADYDTDQASDSHHHSGSTDPHLWWSTENGIVLARALAQQLAQDRPEWQSTLQQNQSRLEARLRNQLAKQRSRLAAGFKPFILAHDAFFYLEEDLGIGSEAAIMLDPESKPGVKHLLALKQRVAAHNIGCVLTGALVPGNLIDKIDTDPPLLRQPLDELGWDYKGERYSEWLNQAYVKLAECVGVSSN